MKLEKLLKLLCLLDLPTEDWDSPKELTLEMEWLLRLQING